ncbi:MAG: homoserine dehydrogenase [Alphaproteobacteria bacterium]|nr:MAG: homoserine dehydrogenase [Alphaproteobacteria bacterium]
MSHAPLRLAIAGIGTVGAGVVSIVQHHAAMLRQRTGRDIIITAVSARDRTRDRGVSLGDYAWCDDAIALAQRDDVDVVVELMGGAEGAARQLVTQALQAGKHVVSANKALIAHHGAELSEIAEAHQVTLAFEAAVAGGIPIIKLIKEGLSANRYERIIGILNGTCNYILSVMERTGRDFADVLAEAQALGYAEADPSFDIDGVDASHKLCILSALAFSTVPNLQGMHCEGIRNIGADDILAAHELGYRIRLLAVTVQRPEGIELRVHPALMPQENKIAQVTDVYNAVHLFTSHAADMFIEGRGAGRDATASAVMADVIDIARGHTMLPFMVPAQTLARAQLVPLDAFDSAYYVRLRVRDTAGVLADLTRCFADHDISVASFIQHATHPNQEATIILTTHITTEAKVRAALVDIKALNSVVAPPCMIRIEEE